MLKRETVYKMGPESVEDYLTDLEERWGVRVEITTSMKRVTHRESLLTLTVSVPEPIHRRELDIVPEVSRVVGRDTGDDIWGVMWAMLYDFDCALQGNPDAA